MLQMATERSSWTSLRVRLEFPDKIVIAGNVATREMTEALILAGLT